MHHLYPLAKGDPLCPLGFHPQVRWPTRCKRCFRDYKEHGGKTRREDNLNKSDTTVSTPSLANWGNDDGKARSWSSSGNLAFDKEPKGNSKREFNNPSSWESTPDLSSLNDNAQANIPTVNIKLPTRKQRPVDRTVSDSVSFRNDLSKRDDKTKRIHIKEIKTITDNSETSSSPSTNNDVQFLIQVKRTPPEKIDTYTDSEDNVSLAGTETTDTTLVDQNEIEYKEQIDSLKKELEMTKSKCERLEKEKSNILLRRLTAMETSSSKNSTEVLKLQQKCNELQSILDDYKDEKKVLSLKVKELEEEMEQRPTAQQAQKIADDLRSKLLAAETLCEELMDENEDMKKELRDLEDEMEEMQDNFREDQADEYTSLKKELEQTTKNCRILSFKLRKTERKVEQLENEKGEIDKKLQDLSNGGQTSSGYLEKIKTLEKELSAEAEKNENLRKELEDAKAKLEPKKLLGPKFGEKRVSRESLTRGGSQEDPAQLLRDLQDSMEREADLREQLKFAEEELRQVKKKRPNPIIPTDVELTYRKPVPLVLFQKEIMKLEKSIQTDVEINILPMYEQRYQSMYYHRKDFSPMTTLLTPIGRKLSPTNQNRSDQLTEKDEGIDDDEDVNELKLQLELSEQEAAVLRKKVEELEVENERAKRKTKELQDKLTIKPKKSTSDAEIKVLQKKLEESEKECQKLNVELKKKNVDRKSDVDTLNFKSQLEAVEQEAELLRTRVQNLEGENEKLTAENKRYQLSRNTKGVKTDKTVSKYIDQIATLEVDLAEANNKIKDLNEKLSSKIDDSKLKLENDRLMETLNKLKSDSSTFKNRTPKKPNELTTKSQLKTWVGDLEKEIADILIVLNNSETSKNKLQEELDKIKTDFKGDLKGGELKSKLIALEKELANEKSNFTKEKNKNDDLTKKLKISDNLKTTNTKLQEEVRKLTDELNNLKNELSSKSVKNDKLKEKELNKLKTDLDERIKKISLLEKENKEIEEKLQKQDKEKKIEINRLETKLEEEKNKSQTETKNLTSQIDDLTNNVLCLETTIKSKNMLIKQLEESLEKERSESSKTKTDTKQLTDLKEELSKAKTNLSEIESKLSTSEKNKKTLETKLKKLEDEFKTEKLKLQKNVGDLEVDLQNEKKKLDMIKVNYEKEHKNKELELGILRNKIKTLEGNGNSKKINEVKQEYQGKLDKLEKTMLNEKKEYEELTAKYEVLEEEHVVTKAKLVAEISALNNQINAMKKEEKSNDTSRNGDLEKVRLKATLEETKLELEQIKREYNVINDQMEYMRRENDELRKKLDDYDKVSKIQRNINDSSALERDIKELQSKLINVEKTKKADLAEYKLRYESQIKIINDELRSLQTQVTRFKRERDTYKHMLEGAQKTIGELKNSDRPNSSSDRRKSISSLDEIEDYKMKIATLEQQVSCMEDELSEARLEGSKLKTELISGRSTYEVKLSELHSRVNELEEEKILISGRTKIAGLRTRMELAWHKEREEQQRLLQETATLARDLRQTLYEVERERDKEKLEGRRKLEQLKKSAEEEQEETKRKLNELQCDLLELRDAHAKLRTTNEKLRREKERNEKERGEMKGIIQGRKRTDQTEDRRLSVLLEQIESVVQSAPDWCQTNQTNQAPYTPTPPRRTRGSRSRESSPALEGSTRTSKESSIPRDDKSAQFKSAIRKLSETADDLKRSQKLSEEERERERIKRVMGTRRATSTEHDDTEVISRTRHYSRNGNLTSSLHRKSLSLEHTSAIHEQNIWKGDSESVSSIQSLEYGSDAENARYTRKDVGMDSRLSGGSTQSDVVEKKKKKGIMGKLKKFTKSRSIDDTDPGHFSSNEALSLTKPDSTSDVNDDTKGSKKDLKERLTGIFKRGGSSSRSNSLERQSKPKDNTSSTQRPLMRSEFQR